MDTALNEQLSFLSQIVPFDALPEAVITKIIHNMSICYVIKDQQLPPKEHPQNTLYIVRKGALSYFANDNELLGKYGEGDICTIFCTTHQATDGEHIKVKTDEDCLLYYINFQTLNQLLNSYPEAISYFNHSSETLLSDKIQTANEEAILASTLFNSAITKFYNAPVATIDQHASITQAAQQMAEKNYSCLVVTKNDHYTGIVTDKDVCRRAVAGGIPLDNPVSAIMSANIITLDINTNAFDAVMLMTAKRIHHLPVTQNNELIGMVSMTDLLNHEGQTAVNITAMINKTDSISALIDLGKMLPKLQQRMSKMGATADMVGKCISAITTAFTVKLIEFFQAEKGNAPVPFAWLGAGSQAREEQMAHSDQDNALIISDDLQPSQQAWFKHLAEFVCDGLAQCGFKHCPGNIMASNDKWRQPQSTWQSYFNSWVDTPSPQALLHSSIFFDMQTVHGDGDLLAQIKLNILKKTAKNSLFIAHLSTNALGFRPPLGFFRDFVLISSGEHQKTIDIKHYGIGPIVDLARIYALSLGINETNTIARLKAATGTPALSRSSGASLIDAYQFLTTLRLEHQTKQMTEGKQPDNYLSPTKLSRLERAHLKAAFKVIKTLQDVRQKTV